MLCLPVLYFKLQLCLVKLTFDFLKLLKNLYGLSGRIKIQIERDY